MILKLQKLRKVEINSTVNGLKFSEKKVRNIFRLLDFSKKYHLKEGVLSVCFLNIEDMCNIHKRFLSNSTLTDVITFQGSEEFNFAGEICISPDYAFQASNVYNTTFSKELTLYLIHGYLHLVGLNDIEQCDIIKMREGENDCMNYLESLNAIPTFDLS